VTASGLVNATNLHVRDGHPIVDGVYVNGHGPYRFLVDTGANVNLIDRTLAESIGLTATFRAELASSAGLILGSGEDGIEVKLGPAKADGQKFLFLGLDVIHSRWTDVQGVLGQWFLSRFDYMLDLRGRQLVFGKQNSSGTRVPLRTVNGRMTFVTSLGDLVLDSGADRLVLFGVQPDSGSGVAAELRTVAGSQRIGMVSGKLLAIRGRCVWRGDAVAMPASVEAKVAGLLPVSLFKRIYVSNSEGYVVLE
jgi:hypothetical protein